VEKVSPAVVNISTVVHERVSPLFPFQGDDFFKDFFPDFFSREYTRTSLGSGVVIDGEKGYIITNHHVVARATEIKVITSDQKEYKGRLVGSDPRADVAVIQIDGNGKLPAVKLGDSDDLMIGETVIAIGNPFGLSHTVTTGVISALDRSVRTDERVYRLFIQTDASINPGNSGGPLLNIEGDVIGINTAIYQKAQGIGFAIPINKAIRIVRELLRVGEVRPIWLGLEVQELTQELRTLFGLPAEKGGVLVSDVIAKGPAEEAGLKRGDVLSAVEEMPVPSIKEYREALAEFTPGDRLNLDLFRKGKALSLSIKPSAFPVEMALDLFCRRLGIRAEDADRGLLRRYDLGKAVAIREVRRDSEAGKIGIQVGDLILQVNNNRVPSLDELKRVISRFHYLPSLSLVVQRGPYTYSLTLPF
ncbi:MAG: trypsin-like peptidase domain-containing protein, partial [Proteobacteria bacterium]|nr:trypsin-like peptidase domain-containing protein [Pseudomonadota bacterium]